MGKRIKGRPCALCSNAAATTREHVPPRSVIPDAWRRELKSNCVTVPACAKCNNGSSDDDSVFKIYVGAHCQFGEHEPAERENLLKTLLKDNRLFEQFFIKSEEVYIQPPGSKVMQPARQIKIDRGVIKRVSKKICRGLHYHEFGEVITSGHYDLRDFSLSDRHHLDTAFQMAQQASLVIRGDLLDGRVNYMTFQLESDRYWHLEFFGRVTVLGKFSNLKVRHTEDGRQARLAKSLAIREAKLL